MRREIFIAGFCRCVLFIVAIIVFTSIRHYFSNFITPFAIALFSGGAADILVYMLFLLANKKSKKQNKQSILQT